MSELKGYKLCSRCKNIKPESEFYKNKSKEDGYSHNCKECGKYYTKKWKSENRDAVKRYNKKNSINRNLIKRYGITLDDKRNMLNIQNNRCKICGNEFEEESSAFVDHKHENGLVRGLLCTKCNTAIGYLQDNPKIIANAMLYVSQNGEVPHKAAVEVKVV